MRAPWVPLVLQRARRSFAMAVDSSSLENRTRRDEKTEEGLGIEYDENVICDVCRSPDSEEANEMVFCDSCNICVHQACYGITTIPSGKLNVLIYYL